MRFKVGDKVRIIEGRGNSDPRPNEYSWTQKLVGNVVTILATNPRDITYLVGNSNTPYCWVRDEWLAPEEEEKKSSSKSDLRASLLVTLDDVAKNPKPYPKHIYKGEGKTVVMWEDGTKTIVKRAEGEPDNDYAAFTAALAIKVFGDNSKVNRIVRMTETVEKRKKKKKQKEDVWFEVVKEEGGIATMDQHAPELVGAFDKYADAKVLADTLNGGPTAGFRTYYVRERESSHATEEEQ